MDRGLGFRCKGLNFQELGKGVQGLQKFITKGSGVKSKSLSLADQGFRVQYLELRVLSSRFGVQGSGLRVEG